MKNIIPFLLGILTFTCRFSQVDSVIKKIKEDFKKWEADPLKEIESSDTLYNFFF